MCVSQTQDLSEQEGEEQEGGWALASPSRSLGDLDGEPEKSQPWMKTEGCSGFIYFFKLKKMLDFII